jgi:hypothetical protein
MNAAPAVITRWNRLNDTAGEPVGTTWDRFFATLAAAPAYLGDDQHPGWSPCTCTPCIRADANVVGIGALVLDYDSGTSLDAAADLWGECLGLIHTTRKHTAESHRFRVILPFSRVLTPAEYPIVWRWAQKLASSAGQRIDASTKNPSRFWYLPGVSVGGAYEARPLTGGAIDPDPILAAHAYEEHERQASAAAANDAYAAGTDLEKRASRYLARMPEAISGSGGHRALWAAALALVRGFRLDPGAALGMLAAEYNPRCQPPWSERELRHKVDQAANDATTPFGYLADKALPDRGSAEAPPDDGWEPPHVPPDFVDDYVAPTLAPAPARMAAPGDWSARLSLTPKGHVRNTFDNTCVILDNHSAYGARLTFDEMRLSPLLNGKPLTDADVGNMRCKIEQEFGFGPSDDTVRKAIATVVEPRSFHPVQRYLNALAAWDGHHRLERVVRDILGAEDTDLARKMIRKWFISAVARVMRPGCKVDTALVLVGPQGYRKSTFFAVLGGEWFADTWMNLEDKDAYLQLHAAWIYEWAEVENVTSRKQASTVKAFVTSKADTFRTPYGHTVAPHQRSNVIVGTTNEGQFLSDCTGSRRFWVLTVQRLIDTVALEDWRDQLWAEALVAYKTGEEWWLDRESEAERERAAAEYVIEDAYEEKLHAWLLGKSEAKMGHLLEFALELKTPQHTLGEQHRVGRLMRKMGWKQHRVGQDRARIWVRPPLQQDLQAA